MSDDCPNCGAPFSQQVSVGMGDSYDDVFGLTLRDLVTTYIRVCLDPEAMKAAGSSSVDADVYLHTIEDLGAGGPFS